MNEVGQSIHLSQYYYYWWHWNAYKIMDVTMSARGVDIFGFFPTSARLRLIVEFGLS